MSKELGKHDFGGSCTPHGAGSYPGMMTFSVGCFEWLQASGGGLKKGKVKVRVSGPVERVDAVHAKARGICDELDAGTYAGPKNVRVKP